MPEDAAESLAPPSDSADHLEMVSDSTLESLIPGYKAEKTTPQPKVSEPKTDDVEKVAALMEKRAEKETPTAPKVDDKKSDEPKLSPLDRLAEHKKQLRNLDGYTPKEQKILRQMSNDTWKFVEPLLAKARTAVTQPDEASSKKISELEKQLSEFKHYRYADHPEAYQLDEEYRTISKLQTTLNQVGQHYQQQLAMVRGGAKVVAMPQFDQQGNVVGLQNFQVTPTTADDILMRLQMIQGDQQTLEQQIGQVKARHAERWKSHDATLGQIYDENFKPHENVLKPLADKHLAAFPAYFRNTVEARLLANSLASGELLAKALETQRATSTVDTARKAAATANGPTNSELETGPTGGKSKSPDLTQEQFVAKYLRGVGI